MLISRLAVAALIIDASTGFFLSGNGRAPNSESIGYGNIEHTLFTSSAVISPAEEIAFEDEDSLRIAYDEWRAKFGAGDFNAARFENFKRNFEMLTKANIEAREQAVAEGQTPPGWMTLNEYGDFSLQEYNQQSGGINGVAIVNGSRASVTQDDFLEMESALEYVEAGLQSNDAPRSPEEMERESKLRALYEQCPDAYKAWCAEVGKEPDTTRFAKFSKNYLAMLIFAERTGKVPQLNQYADYTKQEYDAIVHGPSDDDTAVPPTSKRKTFFIKDSQPKRKTMVIPESKPAPGRATMVIPNAQNARGTQVIRPAAEADAAKGTQVIRRAGVPSPVRGTRVLSRANSAAQGTQVVQPADASGSTKGTQVIRRAGEGSGVRGTQVVKSLSERVSPVKGTRVLKKSVVGTRVVNEDSQQWEEPVNGAVNGAVRQTISISGSEEGSEISLFGGSKVDSNSERSVRGTIVLQRGTTPVQTDKRQTLLVSKSELDGAVPSVFSFFGGAESRNSNTRGTIVIKKNTNDYHQIKGKEKQAELDKIKKAVESKRIEAMRRRDEQLLKSSEGGNTVAAELGPTGTPGDIPSIAGWKQNADGSITGLIYRSMSFKDGTKITTSPVPDGAKVGYLVKTASGSQYILK